MHERNESLAVPIVEEEVSTHKQRRVTGKVRVKTVTEEVPTRLYEDLLRFLPHFHRTGAPAYGS